jgi:uncharacterized protein (TIGR03118 family)
VIRVAAAVAVLGVCGVLVAATHIVGGRGAHDAYVVEALVSDEGARAPRVDPRLVNAWGLAASPTGPWWTSNEASATSTLYSGAGRKQLLTVTVDGGPTGIVYYGGSGFRIASGGASDPARFVYACEDGRLRGWTPTVPTAWSTRATVAVDEGAEAAVFRGLAQAGERLYATDFHNARVAVYDRRWRRVRRRGAFVDRSIPAWYAPFGIRAIGDRIFVTYVWRAPVNGNDAPTGGYVDEFDLAGNLVARVGRNGALNAPWGLALAPPGFGRFGGDLLVGNFGDGRINAYRRSRSGWTLDGSLRDRRERPVVVNGLWGLAFGNDGAAGPARTLFFTAGPHRWRGVTEEGVHGVLGSITLDGDRSLAAAGERQ